MSKQIMTYGYVVMMMSWIGISVTTAELINNGGFEGQCVQNAAGDDIPPGWTKSGGADGSPVIPHVFCVSDNGPSAPGGQSARFVRPTGSFSGRGALLRQTLDFQVNPLAITGLELSLDVKVISHNLEAGGTVCPQSPSFEWPLRITISYTLASNPNVTQKWRHGFYVNPPPGAGDGTSFDCGSGLIPEYKDTKVLVGVWQTHTFDLLLELPDLGEIKWIDVGAAGWGYEGFADNISICAICDDDIPTRCHDLDVCTWDECLNGCCSRTPRIYGDVDGDGDADLFDLFCVLNCFNADYSCGFSNCDLALGCTGDLTINLFDLFAVVNAFSGDDPCCGEEASWSSQASIASSRLEEVTDLDGSAIARPMPVVRFESELRTVRPGRRIAIEVFVSEAAALQGYEIAFDVEGGKRGALEIEDIIVDRDRDDYVFASRESFDTTNLDEGRVAAISMVDENRDSRSGYLATVVLRATADARGVFRIVPRPGDTILIDADGNAMELALGGTATLTVR